MKKYILIFLLSSLYPCFSSAQSTLYKEWFQQKKTQKEYLLEQIAALKVYSEYLKKGYDIYKTGHNAIGNFKRGEFDLHNDFFLSLKSINPEIARYSRIADIVQMQAGIIGISRKTLRELRQEGFAPAQEIDYISKVYAKVLSDCAAVVDELIDLTTPGKLEMEDAERIQRIDLLFAEMQDIYRFTETFSTDARLLSKSRKKEQSDINTLRGLMEK